MRAPALQNPVALAKCTAIGLRTIHRLANGKAAPVLKLNPLTYFKFRILRRPHVAGLVFGFSNPRFSGVARFPSATARFRPHCTQSHCLPCKTLLAGRFGRFWRRSAGILTRAVSWFAAPGLVGLLQSIHGLHRAAGCPGVGSFGCLSEERLLDVFESALVFDSYAQQVLRFRVLVL